MTEARRVVRSTVALSALVVVYVASISISRSWIVAESPALFSAAIAFDVTVTSALVVWWLGVRRAGWPAWTVPATFGAGLATARLVLPATMVTTIVFAAWIAAEVAIAGFAIARIRTIVRVARGHRGCGPIAAVEAGLIAVRVPPRVAAIVASDVMVFALGLGGWFRRPPADGFTMHRRKSWAAIVSLIVFLITVETVAVHLIVALWSPIAAWIVTGSSIYIALWFFADLHALRLYPLRVGADTVEAPVGVRWRVSIPRDAIAGVTACDAVPDGALAATVVEPTVVVALSRPIEVRGPFGIRRTATAIALTVDDSERFIALFATPGA